MDYIYTLASNLEWVDISELWTFLDADFILCTEEEQETIKKDNQTRMITGRFMIIQRYVWSCNNMLILTYNS